MSKKTVLIVDDEPEILDILRVSLEGEGFQCHLAEDGKNALEVFKQNKIQFIISDRKMPVMGGIELLIEIRKISKVPFLLFSNELRIEEDAIAIKLGASNIIRKPIDFELLFRLLKKADHKT